MAPAGSYASMVAAVNAGADAVYMGGTRFGARAFAENPDDAGLLQAIDYVHMNGRRLFLTVNTLLKEPELRDELKQFLLAPVERGLDAVIVQDMGCLRFLREEFPSLPVHISTQGTICGPEGARMLEARGVQRVILPRELSLTEIERIARGCGLEIEVFIHGSLCYCYSGQCLMSSFLGGRSGNRGRCAQPCRLPYEGGYLLNLKDLCGLKTLPALQKAGVLSYKIEGRMKSPAYTAGVVSIYRKYLDLLQEKGAEAYRVDPKDEAFLSSLFDRGGFTEGYYRKHNGADMLLPGAKKAFISADDALLERVNERCGTFRPLAVRGGAVLLPGEPILLRAELTQGGRTVTAEVQGPDAQTATCRPMTEDAVRKPLEKTGESGFSWERLDIRLGENTFVPVGQLNALRRDVLDRLKEEWLRPYRRETSVKAAVRSAEEDILGGSAAAQLRGERLSVSLEDPELLPAVLRQEAVGAVILPTDTVSPALLRKMMPEIRAAGKHVYYALPYIFRQESAAFLEAAAEELRGAAPDGWLVRSADGLGFLREQKLPGMRLGDAGLYVWNRQAMRFWQEEGLDAFTYPYEPHGSELRMLEGGPLPGEMVIYGRIPMMVSAQCLRKTTGACLKAKGNVPAEGTAPVFFLKDRTGAKMPVRTLCRFCYNIIYNAVPLWLADERLPEAARLRIALTDETPEEAERIITRIARGLAGDTESLKPPADLAFTRGHFRKGVQ